MNYADGFGRRQVPAISVEVHCREFSPSARRQVPAGGGSVHGVDEESAQAMFGRLRELVSVAIAEARAVAGENPAWETPREGSLAGTERADQEAKRPVPQAGSWPWRGAPMTAHWALWAMAEQAGMLPAVLNPHVTSYGADVVSRAVLEAASLAWWLLDPGIDAQRRTARWLVWRLHTADETRKAVNELELGDDEDQSGFGEGVEDIQRDIAELGWSIGDRAKRREPDGGSGTASKKAILSPVMLPDGRKESWRGPTDRVADLVKNIWPQGGFPYRRLSAVAHAELWGMSLNLAPVSPGARVLRPTPIPGTALWLWQDAYLVAGALVFTAGRAASFLGLDEYAEPLNALTVYLSHTLAALRPEPG
jgi:hypothetical protein